MLLQTDKCTSHSTESQYKVKVAATCKTSNCVYLIQCKRCGQQHVGETDQALHCRMNNHWADITHHRTQEKPVAAHFNSGVHTIEDMTVMVIERLRKDDAILRKIKEARWIAMLDTSSPKGRGGWKRSRDRMSVCTFCSLKSYFYYKDR